MSNSELSMRVRIIYESDEAAEGSRIVAQLQKLPLIYHQNTFHPALQISEYEKYGLKTSQELQML